MITYNRFVILIWIISRFDIWCWNSWTLFTKILISNAICVINFEHWSWALKISSSSISSFFVLAIRLAIAKSSRSRSWWTKFSEIWKRRWVYTHVSSSRSMRFESLCSRYTIGNRVFEKKRSRHVSNVLNCLNSDQFLSSRSRCSLRSLSSRLSSWSLQLTFISTLKSRLVTRWSTSWSSRTNVSHVANWVTFEKSVRTITSIKNVIGTKCKYRTWI